MLWDLKKCIEISKNTEISENALKYQTMLWDLKKMQCNLKEMVDIVEIVQADVVFVDIVGIVDTVKLLIFLTLSTLLILMKQSGTRQGSN